MRTHIHNGVKYFADPVSARVCCAEILGRKAADIPNPFGPFDPLPATGTRFPTARVVPYDRGFAVQYYISGPYYPELESSCAA